jgi:hypothetical protein
MNIGQIRKKIKVDSEQYKVNKIECKKYGCNFPNVWICKGYYSKEDIQCVEANKGVINENSM